VYTVFFSLPNHRLVFLLSDFVLFPRVSFCHWITVGLTGLKYRPYRFFMVLFIKAFKISWKSHENPHNDSQLMAHGRHFISMPEDTCISMQKDRGRH